MNKVGEQIKEYFLSKGHRILSSSEFSNSVEGQNLAFSDGESVIFVRILSEEELADRNSLLNAALQSLSFVGKANKVYLALPKIYATILDSEVIQNRGLGLLVFDERKVAEVILPKFFELQAPITKKLMEEIEDLKGLKNRVLDLERTVRSLTRELSRLKSTEVKIKELKLPAIEVPISTGLPSFFKDNPWVEILTRRGREPERAAG